MDIDSKDLANVLLTAVDISKKELIRELSEVDVTNEIDMEKVIELMRLWLDVYDNYIGAVERLD